MEDERFSGECFPENSGEHATDGFVDHYCELTNDLLFHMVFSQNMDALKSLLSSLLNIPMSEILDIKVLNPLQYNESFDTKTTILDLKVHLNEDRYVLIEMQVRRFEEWTNRSLLYGCRQIDEQSRGRDFTYEGLQPVIQISIMDHTLFPDHRRFFAKYEIRDNEGYPYTDKLSFYVLDLTAVEDATEEEKKQGLVDWASAFNAENWEEVNQIDNEGVQEAKKSMERIMSDSYRRQQLWDRKLAEMDYRSQMSSAEKRGIEIGEKRGEKRGWNSAKQEAEDRDRQRVRNMHALGKTNDEIALYMDLNVEQVKEWLQ